MMSPSKRGDKDGKRLVGWLVGWLVGVEQDEGKSAEAKRVMNIATETHCKTICILDNEEQMQTKTESCRTRLTFNLF
jgi:hypothetical protein